MPLSEYDSKEALRIAADWLKASEVPGSAAALEGIADTIGLFRFVFRCAFDRQCVISPWA